MKRWAVLLSALLAMGPAFGDAPPPADRGLTLRVMTYNLHSCKGRDGKIRPDRIADAIARVQPDIVALQEVRVGRVEAANVDKPSAEGPGTPAPPVGQPPLPPPTVLPPKHPGTTPGPPVPFTDQPRTIADRLGMGYVFYPLVRTGQQDYGIALLSKYPIRLVRAGNLPTDPGRWFGEKRGAIWAEVTVKGRPVQVIATHLGLNSSERERQVTALLGPEWTKSPDFRAPYVICGDLNSTPVQDPYKRFSSVFLDAARSAVGDAVQATWPARWPVARLDHIFLPPENARAFSAQVPKNALTRVASDHLPLVVDVLFETPAFTRAATETPPAPHASTRS